nr:immunoglobulin heavy chain junction region [Macaca mulatta]MOV49763.1 immunoglobulin heavy chain junction region [Macaca mulatta]MOV50222.1 immunoglobulin heavy chain junction region [Macaca mulatta]MOV50337.1 immunoglobulin heavy chain junction region [Macaca mulatta]MOV50353.1 immunoglobulin heavy chain junction region [Macaca mulatta]
CAKDRMAADELYYYGSGYYFDYW